MSISLSGKQKPLTEDCKGLNWRSRAQAFIFAIYNVTNTLIRDLKTHFDFSWTSGEHAAEFLNCSMDCYNCGAVLTNQTNHREHIPAKNLFDGFPDSHKQNRIAVPACYSCNQSYSPIDEEFRNLIGIINKHPGAFKLAEKTSRSMSRWQSRIARVVYSISNRMPFAVQFNTNDIAAYHIKNFKGIFYYKYGRRISTDQYRILAHFDKNFETERSQRLISYLTKNFPFEISGHEDVFRYILQPFRQGYNFDGQNIPPTETEQFFMAIISYTKNHAALVMAERLPQ